MTNKEALEFFKRELARMNSDGCFTCNMDEEEQALRVAIRALEQPEIIRCKECKYADFSCSVNTRCYCMEHERYFYEGYFYEDDFCSKAERRCD